MKNKKLFYIILITVLIIIPNTAYALAASCPIGPEVTKDIKGALRIIQVLGPILTVLFTIWDIIRGLTKGEIEKEMRTIWQRTYKRLIAAFFLFFIPLLINQAFQLFGLYDNESCNFDDNPGNTPQTARSCADRGLTYNSETKRCGGNATKAQICSAYNGRKTDNEDAAKCEATSGCKYNMSTGKCNAKEETECYLLSGVAGSNEQAAKCEAVSGCSYDFTTGKCNNK